MITESSDLEIIARGTEQLGTALMRFRKKEEWNQQRVAERAGVKQPVVSLVESGATGTKLETLFKILAALDLELVVRKRRKSNSWSRDVR